MAQFHEIDSSQFSDVVPDGSEKIQIGATKRTNLQNIADLFDVFSHLKAGSNIALKKESDGTVTITANNQSYSLPKASSTVLGGVKVGKNLTIDSSGTLSANDQSVNPSPVDVLRTKLTGLKTSPDGSLFDTFQTYSSSDTLLGFLNKLINNIGYNQFRLVNTQSSIILLYSQNDTPTIPGTVAIRFIAQPQGVSFRLQYSVNKNHQVSYFNQFTTRELVNQLVNQTEGWLEVKNINLMDIDSGSGGGESYELPVATSSVLGGVKVPGTNPISVDGTGNLSLKYSTTYGLNYISGYLGLSLCTVPWVYSGFGANLQGFNLKERQFIFWSQSEGASVMVTINLNNSDWNMMGMSIISVLSSTNKDAAIHLQISGGTCYFMGESGNTGSKQISNIVKYSAIVFKLITISNSKRILVIPIPRAQ